MNEIPKPDRPTQYKLTIDWPDFPDGITPSCTQCDAQELRRTLAMLPQRISQHRIDAAPLMIEVHES